MFDEFLTAVILSFVLTFFIGYHVTLPIVSRIMDFLFPHVSPVMTCPECGTDNLNFHPDFVISDYIDRDWYECRECRLIFAVEKDIDHV